MTPDDPGGTFEETYPGITPMFEPVSDGWHHVLWFPMVGGAFGVVLRTRAIETGILATLHRTGEVLSQQSRDALIEGEEGDAILSEHLGDRETVELPQHQRDWLLKVMDAGTPVIVVILAFNFLGDGLRDAADPYK